jgi:hypothetical protein
MGKGAEIVSKLKLYARRTFIILLSLLPSACHMTITFEWLIKHGSGAAFEMAISGWILCALVILYAVIVASTLREQK